MATRYYKVSLVVPGNKEMTRHEFLVDANSPGQAASYVGKKFIRAQIAKPEEIVQFMQGGGKPEKVSAE